MNTNLNKQDIDNNTDLVYNTVIDLLDSFGGFITNTLISEKSGLDLSTVSKYSKVYKDEIDEHNQVLHGTKSHNQYLHNVSMNKINQAIEVLKSEDQIVNIKTIAKESKLHRNTVSKLNQKHKFI